MSKENIGSLKTEGRNPKTLNLDTLTTLEMVEIILKEEESVLPACLKASKQLSDAVDLYASVLKGKGRIIEAGSGCSGDYAHTDVLELAATFSQEAYGDIKKDKVMGLHIQKGWYVDTTRRSDLIDFWVNDIKSRDTSEDSLTQPAIDLENFNFGKDDLLVVVTASGRSPIILELAKEAKKRGGKVISLVMNYDTQIKEYSDVVVEAVVGKPPLTGSGRMLSGTASKVLITTLSTASHVKAGSVYSNLMVNLNVKNWVDNSKFVDRAARIIQTITEKSFEESHKLLKNSNWNIKAACVMAIKKVSFSDAKELLSKNGNNLRNIIG